MLLELETTKIEYIIPFTTLFSIIVLVIGCTCWKKKVIKNDLLGLEGLVKIKNPDDNVNSSTSFITVEPKSSISNIQAEDLKSRGSAAPHRSLPDIPQDITQVGDTNSELYATVGDTDKVLEKPQGRSPSSIIKTQPSVSQHSSLSQADDISSPYARVKSPHAYDRVRHTEHPYAQLNQIGSVNISTIDEVMSSSGHQHSTSQILSDSNENIIVQEEESHEIPAASAIAGRIAASQDLPYMTPPIVQPLQQNFSGDSQDSSKGYTSISVREPLANILAQTNQSNNHQVKRRETNDSHYATVSDDSDEMYAAIDDPNNRGDLYTSGSETYAQIQPPPTSLTVSVEINATPRPPAQDTAASRRVSTASSQLPATSNNVATSSSNSSAIQNNEAATGELKAQMHSRQASSSSCTSSVGNLGSPKPEKRQANSPLPPPPTPKSSIQSQHSSTSNLTSTSSNPSGRNSVASVIEVGALIKSVSKENLNGDIKSANKKTNGNDDANKKKLSPSKDLEGMYAKVMKKSKLSNFPSQNSSPVLARKFDNSSEPVVASNHEIVIIDTPLSVDTVDHVQVNSNNTSGQDNNYETIDKRKLRYDNKDPGYETIPGNMNHQDLTKTKPELYTNEAGYESLPDRNTISITNVDPGYEFVTDKSKLPSSSLSLSFGAAAGSGDSEKPKSRNLIQRNSSEYDPNYEVLRPSNNNNNNSEKSLSDDGYAKVLEKTKPTTVINDGYSSIKSVNKRLVDSAGGYSTIKEANDVKVPLKNHDYASIKETNPTGNLLKCNDDDENSDIYSSIPSSHTPPYLSIPETSILNNYSTINETTTTTIHQHSGGGSTTSKSPNNSLSITKSLINSPDYSSVSETRTTPSTDSINSSATDVQIGYNSLQNDLSYTNQSSNYESLTESESDPNYESVKYKISNENPYERLEDKSPDQRGLSMSNLIHNNNNNNISSSSSNNSNSLTTTKTTINSKIGETAVEVSDYFQV